MTSALKTIDKSTMIPIGVAVTVCAGIISQAVWLNNRLTAMDYNIRETHDEVIQQREDYRKEQQIFKLQLKAANPNLNIPE